MDTIAPSPKRFKTEAESVSSGNKETSENTSGAGASLQLAAVPSPKKVSDPASLADTPTSVAVPTSVPTPEPKDEWKTTGHKWLGKTVVRIFPHAGPATCKVTKWVPEEGDDQALWHIVHKDGDEEDLEEYEMEEALGFAGLGAEDLNAKVAEIDAADFAKHKAEAKTPEHFQKYVLKVEKQKKKVADYKKKLEAAQLRFKLQAQKAEERARLAAEKAKENGRKKAEKEAEKEAKKKEAKAKAEAAKAKATAVKAEVLEAKALAVKERKAASQAKETAAAERALKHAIQEACKEQHKELKKLAEEEKKAERLRANRLAREARLQSKTAIEDSLVRRSSSSLQLLASGDKDRDMRLLRPLPYNDMATLGLPPSHTGLAGRLIGVWDFLHTFSGPAKGGKTKNCPQPFLPLTQFDMFDLTKALAFQGDQPVQLLGEVCHGLLVTMLSDLEEGGSMWKDLQQQEKEKKGGGKPSNAGIKKAENADESDGDDNEDESAATVARREEESKNKNNLLLHPPRRSMLSPSTWQAVLLALVRAFPALPSICAAPAALESEDAADPSAAAKDGMECTGVTLSSSSSPTIDMVTQVTAALGYLETSPLEKLQLPEKLAVLVLLVQGAQRTEAMRDYLDMRTQQQRTIIEEQRQEQLELKAKMDKANPKRKGKSNSKRKRGGGVAVEDGGEAGEEAGEKKQKKGGDVDDGTTVDDEGGNGEKDNDEDDDEEQEEKEEAEEEEIWTEVSEPTLVSYARIRDGRAVSVFG
jgi:hypothetical protein